MAISKDAIITVGLILKNLECSKGADEHWKVIACSCAAVLDGNSPYRETRAVVDRHDNPDEPVSTIRAWVIGLIRAGALAAINQFFAPRQPAITVTIYLAQLFGFLMGRTCATVLPTKIFFSGTRYEFTLNPGPWTLKEQSLITIMANVSYVTPLITNLFFMQRLPMYLGQEWASSFGYGLCVMLSTQLLGYGLAGFCRRFLVYPANILWYFVLSQISMNKAFVEEKEMPVKNWKISRFKFFFAVFTGAFCYYWIPGTIMPTMTFFNWITWIKPASATTAIITGTYYFNMGFNPISTLDYQWFSTVDPFVTPWFVVLQIIGSVAFWGICVIIPIYQTSLILGTDHKLNQTAFEAYSPLFLPAAFGLRYAGMLALLPALFVFTTLWYGKMLGSIFKSLFRRDVKKAWEGDVHYRLMSAYNEVPDWWYLAIATVAMALGFASIYAWPTNIPGWIFPLSFFASAVFIIPIGVLTAVTGYQTDLEILFNIIGGLACKGDPVGTFVFKTLGKSIIQQAVFFTADMKLAHYMKIPPKVMMLAQVVATVVASFVSLGLIQYQITSIDGICDSTKQQRWICSGVATNWTSAIVWGALGPRRIFGEASLYKFVPMGLLAGALWPLPWYFARNRWPNSFLRYCHPLIMMIGPILWAPSNFSNLWQALPVAFVAGYWVKTRYVEWWNKYNYVLSTALLSGIAFSTIIQFAAISNKNVTFPEWWGTTQYLKSCDLQDCRWLKLAEGETFGPKEWS
ncbi:OPT oligopeptide transporter protein-domain-containing protein [Ilyonectria sp. MPI-CAGE-AT-0026]|nr:OPT oligopeptide transporter protein-domain-containing protein [Ilyonectria sp. MPI-CAGE-AT-0026]